MYIDILRRLRDAVRGKRAKELRTNISFLLHDNSSTQVSFGQRFLSKEQCDNTGGYGWFFTFYLDSNRHWMDGTSFMLLTSLRMRRKSWKGFHKMGPRNVYTAFGVAGRRVHLHKGNLLKSIHVLFCISQKQSDSRKIMKLSMISVTETVTCLLSFLE
jgi:hypothetical protein